MGFALVLCGQALSLLAQEAVSVPILPGDKDSHLRFIERSDSDRAEGLEGVLEVYRRHVAKHPDDVSAFVEYCQFLDLAFLDDDEGINTRQDQLDAVQSEIRERFPQDPIAQLYLCSNLYDESLESAIERLSQDGFPGWSDAQKAELYKQLAWDRYQSMDYEAAGEAALEAVGLDTSLNLTIPLAQYYLELEQPREALNALTRWYGSDEDRWRRGIRASLLVECKAYVDAIRVFAEMEENLSATDLVKYAKCLEETGAIDGARSRLKLATTRAWSNVEPYLEWFEFELRHGNRELAIESYQSMLDEFENADLLLRHRFDLMAAHTDIPWHEDNFMGLIILVVGIGFLMCLPLVWILPIQCWGLKRVLSGKTDTDTKYFWSMRHFWWGSALYLLTSVFILYWFDYGGFYDFLNDDEQLEYVFSYKDNPNALVSFFVVMGVGVLISLRFRHLKLIFTNRLSVLKSFFVVFLSWFGLMFVARLIRSFDVLGAGVVHWGGMEPMAVSQLGESLLVVHRVYGPMLVFGLIAVLVPLYEEIIFRGMILDSCQRYFPFYLVNTFQALLFMVIHESVAYFPYYFLVGLVAGLLRKHSKGLFLPICLHVMINGFVWLSMTLWIARRG